MGFWQKFKKDWKKSDDISAEVGSGINRRDQNIEYSRGGMATMGIQGGTDPTLKQASELDERASEQTAEFRGVGPEGEPADTGEALEKDMDEHLGNIHKWSEEDEKI